MILGTVKKVYCRLKKKRPEESLLGESRVNMTMSRAM